MTGMIDRYLAALRQELWGGPSLRERILWEVEDHLLEGAQSERERGTPPEEAQRRVIERFGLPQVMAQLFAAEAAADEGGNMWQQFTERARNVIFFAQGEAARLGESFVGTEQLLLGLVHEDNLAVRVLQSLGVAPVRVRGDLEQQVKQGPGGGIGEMQLTPRSKRVIDLAYEESQAQSLDYIGTEHLLLALVREEEGLAGRVLAELGVELERTRREIAAIRPIWVEIEKARQALEANEAVYRALVAGPTSPATPATPGPGGGEAEESVTAAEEEASSAGA